MRIESHSYLPVDNLRLGWKFRLEDVSLLIQSHFIWIIFALQSHTGAAFYLPRSLARHRAIVRGRAIRASHADRL